MKRLRGLKDWVRQLLGTPGGRQILAGGAAAATFIVSISAHAAGGGGGHGEPHLNLWEWDDHAPPTGWFILDFLIFVGLIIYLARGPIKKMFVERHEAVKNALEEAQAAFTKAKAFAEEYADKLQRVEEEGKKLSEGAERDGREERDRTIKDAESYVDRMRKDTGDATSQEAELARKRLQRELARDVLRLAGEKIEQEMNDADQQRLIEQAISELEDGKARITSSREAPRRAG